MMIDIAAIIREGVQIGEDVEIGPYCIVDDHSIIGNGCRLGAHAIVRRHSILGDNVRVDSFAVIGGEPQDLKFDPSIVSGVKIGNKTVIREGVTIHRATKPDSFTYVGEGAYLMANAHVAHDCVVSDYVVMANNVMLGGEVKIGAYCFLGGGAGIHQFVHIGDSVMLGATSMVSRDIPHYLTVANRNTAYGLNLLGLKRRGFSQDEISDIKRAYRAGYMADGVPARLAKAALESDMCKTDKGRRFLEFFEKTRLKRFVYSKRDGEQA